MRLLFTLALLAATSTYAQDRVAPDVGDSTSVAVPEVVVVHDTVEVPVPAPMTAFEDSSLRLRVREIAARERAAINEERRDDWQIKVWVFGFGALVVGGFLTWLRIHAQEEAASAPHNDEMFRTFLERFADTAQGKNIRIASCIGLRYTADMKSHLLTSLRFWRRKYPFRMPVIHLLVESIFTEEDPDVLNTIRDQLIEIGGPALQTLVNRHREWFPAWHTRKGWPHPPSWLPLKSYDVETGEHEVILDELPTNFVGACDTIAGIIRKAEPGNLAASGSTVYTAFFMPRVRNVAGVRWLDQVGLSDMALIGADLESANLHGTILAHARLDGADLSSADLQLSYLEGAIFNGADLTGTSLSGVSALRFAHWAGCNWRDAEDISQGDRQWLAEHYPYGDT